MRRPRRSRVRRPPPAPTARCPRPRAAGAAPGRRESRGAPADGTRVRDQVHVRNRDLRAQPGVRAGLGPARATWSRCRTGRTCRTDPDLRGRGGPTRRPDLVPGGAYVPDGTYMRSQVFALGRATLPDPDLRGSGGPTRRPGLRGRAGRTCRTGPTCGTRSSRRAGLRGWTRAYAPDPDVPAGPGPARRTRTYPPGPACAPGRTYPPGPAYAPAGPRRGPERGGPRRPGGRPVPAGRPPW